MGKLLPLLLVLLGLAAGMAAGLALRPGPEAGACDAAADAAADGGACPETVAAPPAEPDGPTAFVELQRQFVVPLLREERVVALVVASLALEVDAGAEESAFLREPKLRDAFLQVLFVHAHSGGFDGDFTAQAAIADLKARLVEAARPILGPALHDVLLTEIVRQDY